MLNVQDEKSIIYFGNKEKILGSIILQDKLREESKEVIDILNKRQIRTLIISGDNKNAVFSTQKILNLNEIHYELKPDEKQNIIEQYKLKKNKIAMIGDGVNDAPSLALANVGIAMGGIGSDVSMETADVILIKDNLRDLISFLDISYKTTSIIKYNISFSILIKLAFVFLTFFGFMTLYIAVGIGDLGVTLIVILNAFRISRINFYSKKSNIGKTPLENKKCNHNNGKCMC